MQTKSATSDMSKGFSGTLDLKSLKDDGTFEGYCAIFNIPDQGNDMIAPGAFKKSLRLRPAAKVKMLWQHRWAEPVGVWEELKEDAKGLWGQGRLLMDVHQGRECYALMKAEALDGLSIGFRTIKFENGRDSDAYDRKLTELELWEVSPVTFPMHTGATITAVKGMEDNFIVKTLLDAGLPDEFAADIVTYGVGRAKELLNAREGHYDPAVVGELKGSIARLQQLMER